MDLRHSHGSLNHDAGTQYTVEKVSTEDGLSAIEDEWNRLSETSDHQNAFMTYGWYRAWIRGLSGQDGFERLQPHILVILQDGVIVGIAPMVRRISSRIWI